MSKLTALAPSLALAVVIAGSTFASAGAVEKPKPNVSMAHAKTIALHAQPGTVVASELESETGGSGLRYSFDIRVGKTTHEVGVDAKTGAVLENNVEGKNPD